MRKEVVWLLIVLGVVVVLGGLWFIFSEKGVGFSPGVENQARKGFERKYPGEWIGRA
jgi:hypothetical protein